MKPGRKKWRVKRREGARKETPVLWCQREVRKKGPNDALYVWDGEEGSTGQPFMGGKEGRWEELLGKKGVKASTVRKIVVRCQGKGMTHLGRGVGGGGGGGGGGVGGGGGGGG